MSEPRIHTLKTIPAYWEAVASGAKPFEVRLDDRGFEVGDLLVLEEWRDQAHTGRTLERRVTYILRGAEAMAFGVHRGYAVLGLAPGAPHPAPTEAPQAGDLETVIAWVETAMECSPFSDEDNRVVQAAIERLRTPAPLAQQTDVAQQVADAFRSGGKAPAVKLYRQLCGTDLTASVEAVRRIVGEDAWSGKPAPAAPQEADVEALRRIFEDARVQWLRTAEWSSMQERMRGEIDAGLRAVVAAIGAREAALRAALEEQQEFCCHNPDCHRCAAVHSALALTPSAAAQAVERLARNLRDAAHYLRETADWVEDHEQTCNLDPQFQRTVATAEALRGIAGAWCQAAAPFLPARGGGQP